MSMGGLAVAIGLVIDDAVVVVENIHRRLESGMERAHVVAATHELVAPIVGSTLTTVVVFAPLALLSGVTGQFFRVAVDDAVGRGAAVARAVADAGADSRGPGHCRSHVAQGHRVASADRRPTRTVSAVCCDRPVLALVAAARSRSARPGALLRSSGEASCPRWTRAGSSSTT